MNSYSNMEFIEKNLYSLLGYCEGCGFRGYDPYDTLNSPLLRRIPGSILPAIFIQLQKKNLINIRPVLGIKKGTNPKAMGLFLKAYCLLFKKTQKSKYLEKAKEIFNWLKGNFSKGYSGYAWGYDFNWSSPGSYLKAYTPSVVVTSFVVDGLFEYFKITDDIDAKEIIISAAKYIKKDIPLMVFDEGISFSYTHLSKGACYNASLLATEVLAKANMVASNQTDHELIKKAVNFILSKQKSDGSWNYSLNLETGTERKQIDFHQGFILVSLHNICEITGILKQDIHHAIDHGLSFYKKKQFFSNGRALWRLPKEWPVDIHNQSQGIITFAKLNMYPSSYGNFAQKIASWTIEHMQDQKGYFYYRKFPYGTNKIPYMRWSQAWMMLALVELYCHEK